jgi:phospholipid-binding lipoprotein MlaA
MKIKSLTCLFFLTLSLFSTSTRANIIIPELFVASLEEGTFQIDLGVCETDQWGIDEEEYAKQPSGDPLEWLNRHIFTFNDFVYTAAIRPFTNTYTKIVPVPVRSGIGNFFDNLKFPIRFVNSALQLKGEKMILETEKFLINSTVGILGIMTPAQDKWDINPRGEDMGQTFGHWGIGHGAYLVLPLMGPTSIRDFVGRIGDGFLSPINYTEDDEVRMAGNIIEIVNGLPEQMDLYFQLKEGALDPYSSMKNGYMQIRLKKVNE